MAQIPKLTAWLQFGLQFNTVPLGRPFILTHGRPPKGTGETVPENQISLRSG